MQTIRQATELAGSGRKVALAIGTFDGVHLGHQQVIRQAVAEAERHEGLSVAVTFDCHPASVVAPERTPPLIYTVEQKLRAIAALGVDATLMLHFDRALSERTGDEFIRDLVSGFRGVQSITVGASFGFGHRRSGNVALLQSLGQPFGFEVHGIADVALDGQPVSSTRIREAIRGGALDRASEMLGRAYSICGVVTRGDRIGSQLGFPTANVDTTGRVVPPNGVYAVHAYVGATRHRAVLNIGMRPTLSHPAPQLRVEAHLLGFVGDLYEQVLEITFVKKLRDEQKFPSLDALKTQIQQDIAAAELVF